MMKEAKIWIHGQYRYIFVKEERFESAMDVLSEAGYEIA